MLWFYWRRARFGVMVTAIALVSIVALIALADSVGTKGHHSPARRTLASRFGTKMKNSATPKVSLAEVRRGEVLMDGAVIACRSVTYRGTQMIAWWGDEESTAYLIQVWHSSGEPEVADGATGADEQPTAVGQPATIETDHATAGVLSLSAWMLNRLRLNYLIEYAGSGTADDRSAQIVAVRRRDGSLAARYWLDQATGLPLRREMFDSAGHLVNEGAFIDLKFGGDPDPAPSRAVQAWTAQPSRSDLIVLERQGWPVPSTLDGDMSLVGVSRTKASGSEVLDASYSDGLSVVSVFLERGVLARALPGWTKIKVGNVSVYSGSPDERSLTWSAGGIVYTVISDAPAPTVDQIVVQLPHDRDGGLWGRVRRGLKRIGSWFNPFG
jgi:sigma-E factor negative regulatory protein RseB